MRLPRMPPMVRNDKLGVIFELCVPPRTHVADFPTSWRDTIEMGFGAGPHTICNEIEPDS